MSHIECADRPEIDYAERIARRITDRYSNAVATFADGIAEYDSEEDVDGWPHIRRNGGYARVQENACSNQYIGQLIEFLGLQGLKDLLTLSDDEFCLVMEDNEVSVTKAQRLKLLEDIEEHHRGCRRCEVVSENHQCFAEVFDYAMKNEGRTLESVTNGRQEDEQARVNVQQSVPFKRCVPRLP
jgi:hypothetical protein